jgi:hypothetical protein
MVAFGPACVLMAVNWPAGEKRLSAAGLAHRGYGFALLWPGSAVPWGTPGLLLAPHATQRLFRTPKSGL